MAELTHEGSARPPAPNLGRRLTGWKEIAAHLDRGVRTAQRWEREFGMPVRRMGIGSPGSAGRSESVFAYAGEIDGWLESASAARAQGQLDRPAAVSGDGVATSEAAPAGTPVQPADAAPVSAVRQHRLLWGLAALVVLLSAVGLWRELGRQPGAQTGPGGPPASWRLEADSLVVSDAEGRILWSHSFGVPVALNNDPRIAAIPTGGIADLDGDGSREVWFVVTPVDASTTSSLNLFEANGARRWVYTPTEAVTFGDGEKRGPWTIRGAAVTESPEDPASRAMWVVAHDSAEFPSFLTRIDVRSGLPVGGRFWSSGWLASVALMHTPEGPRLVVTGTNNEHRSPAVALLDARDISGSAPAVSDKYRCTSCPPASPLAFTLLPRPHRFAQAQGSGTAIVSSVGNDGQPIVVVPYYAVSPDDSIASAVVQLDEALRPLHADYSDTYESAYRKLVEVGQVAPAGPIAADPSRELLPLQRWQDNRFVPVGIERKPIAASSSNGPSPTPAPPYPIQASGRPRARNSRVLLP